MTSVNRWNPEGVRALFDVLNAGSGSFEGGSLRMALLDADTTADTEWDTVTNLGAYTDLSEFTGAGYSRQTLANVLVTKTGSLISLTHDNQVIASLASATPALEQVLYYVEKSGAATDADRVPLYLGDADTAPDGGSYTIAHPTGGLSLLETDP